MSGINLEGLKVKKNKFFSSQRNFGFVKYVRNLHNLPQNISPLAATMMLLLSNEMGFFKFGDMDLICSIENCLNKGIPLSKSSIVNKSNLEEGKILMVWERVLDKNFLIPIPENKRGLTAELLNISQSLFPNGKVVWRNPYN